VNEWKRAVPDAEVAAKLVRELILLNLLEETEEGLLVSIAVKS
jgi:hypothetical protein